MSKAKELPSAPDAEWSLLGACLLDPSAIDDAYERVSPEDFLAGTGRAELYRFLLDADESQRADIVCVAEHLKNKDPAAWEAIGKNEGIMAMVRGCPHPSNAGFYAKIIADAAWHARVIVQARDAYERIRDSHTDHIKAQAGSILGELAHCLGTGLGMGETRAREMIKWIHGRGGSVAELKDHMVSIGHDKSVVEQDVEHWPASWALDIARWANTLKGHTNDRDA